MKRKIHMSFEKNLKALRLSLFQTQREVADALHLSKSTYSNFERGSRRPDVDMIYQLADYFKVNVATLFIDTEAAPKTDQTFCVAMSMLQQELLAHFEVLSETGRGRLMERAKALQEEERLTRL